MKEYLGGSGTSEVTAVFVTNPSPLLDHPFQPYAASYLPELLTETGEAARSLWDLRSLIVHLDLELVDFDCPWGPLADRGRTLRLQLPVLSAIEVTLRRYGITPLRLVTGRGFHLTWRVARDSRAFASLSRLGQVDGALLDHYRKVRGPRQERLGPELGAAHAGLGKVMEWLGHRWLEMTAGATEVPVQLTAVSVGPGSRGREAISIDLSAFGDPVHNRSARIPFTLYRKARHLGAPAELLQPTWVTVPIPPGEAPSLDVSESLDAARKLAAEVCTTIPDASVESEGLLEDYESSALAAYHRSYEAIEMEPPHRWPETYDRLEAEALPSCVRRILEYPNDSLLKPAGFQHLVRMLVSRGWSGRHVAGLVRSRFERDYGWIPDLHFHEPSCRADFYARLFSGLMATGRDRLVDFNCRSALEKDLCPRESCDWNLAEIGKRFRGNHDF